MIAHPAPDDEDGVEELVVLRDVEDPNPVVESSSVMSSLGIAPEVIETHALLLWKRKPLGERELCPS